MKVLLPSLLDAYTRGAREVEGRGGTLFEVLADLEGRYPGLRFRIVDEQDRVRPHVRVFVGDESVRDLARAVGAGDTVMIVGALSGG